MFNNMPPVRRNARPRRPNKKTPDGSCPRRASLVFPRRRPRIHAAPCQLEPHPPPPQDEDDPQADEEPQEDEEDPQEEVEDPPPLLLPPTHQLLVAALSDPPEPPDVNPLHAARTAATTMKPMPTTTATPTKIRTTTMLVPPSV
ncbi:hypothetical protein ACODT3_17280 [Streptomyces sp. 4.24]|uniref:hypothetical protein n=1 Tax=Streptomyces tritrimontium TaxID=3406573 RepID=UPI003BB4BCAA